MNIRLLKECTNDAFMGYFKKYESIRNKWVHCFMKDNDVRTNLHIESWHRILKYNYLGGKKNKRADTLIVRLLEMSKDTQYKENMKKIKGVLSTFNRKTSARHNNAMRVSMKIIDRTKIQVIY